MKSNIQIFLVTFFCLCLPVQDMFARGLGGRGGGGGGGGGGRKMSKPVSRPSVSKKPNRSPVTSSRPQARPSKPVSRPTPKPSRPVSRPTPKPSKPVSRPTPKPSKPVSRPTPKPSKPVSRPTTRPSIPTTRPAPKPSKPVSRPTTRPSIPTTRPAPKPSKPTTRPSIPMTRPAPKPSRPTTRPSIPNRPTTRPAVPSRPSTLPGNVGFPKPGGPSTRPNFPGNNTRPALPGKGGDRPSTLPARPDRPNPGDRPSTLPARPDRPNPGDRPSTLPVRPDRPDRPGNRPGQLPSRPDFGNRPDRPDRPGLGDRPSGGDRPWYNRPGRGDTNINIGSNNNIKINNNFRNNINWSTNRKNWGYSPWWNRPSHYPWYGGSWRCGWARPPYRYYPPRFPGYYYGGTSAGEVIAWGLVGWGLGNLIFDCGYSSYRNPYPPQPVVVSSGTEVTYNQPITVVAAETLPASEEVEQVQAEKSESFINEALASFEGQDYVAALDSVNKAIAEAPGDGAFHEFRALVLYALGQYEEAAGVLHPMLASSPGWDWSTMIQLYDSEDTYASQLRKLEEYTVANTDSAASAFLLGYHYMICTHLDEAAAAFTRAAELADNDPVATQLASLASSSVTSGDETSADETTEVAEAPPEAAAEVDSEAPGSEEEPAVEPVAEPVPFEQLVGSWASDNGENGTVNLSLGEDGKFTWTFSGTDGEPFSMEGDYNLGQQNILTLDAGDSQMAATVSLSEEGDMTFVLAGGPPGDPGLNFKKG